MAEAKPPLVGGWLARNGLQQLARGERLSRATSSRLDRGRRRPTWGDSRPLVIDLAILLSRYSPAGGRAPSACRVDLARLPLAGASLPYLFARDLNAPIRKRQAQLSIGAGPSRRCER